MINWVIKDHKLVQHVFLMIVLSGMLLSITFTTKYWSLISCYETPAHNTSFPYNLTAFVDNYYSNLQT